MSEKMKIAVFCQQGLTEFVQPIINELKKHHEVRLSFAESPEETTLATRWADVVWLEWGNEVAQKLTNARGFLENKYTILRVHSYEIFAEMLPRIRWAVVDHLICPNKHTMNLALISAAMESKHLERIKRSVIPSGINMSKFSFTKRNHGQDIAFVARLNHKKGLELMLQVAKYLKTEIWEKTVMEFQEFHIHIAGTWQDTRLLNYFNHMVEKMQLQDVIKYYGWVDPSDMAGWLEDKQYILCTSPFESQGVGIMEAMARGIKPLVHWFPGAEENFPEECLWTSVSGIESLLDQDYNSNKYRAHIEKNYSLSQVMKKVNRALPSPDDIQSARHDFQLSSATNQADTSKPIDGHQTQETPGGDGPGANTGPVRLAVALMYGNEEDNLERCLKSVKPFADVIVAMDTGSTDSSTKILESYNVSVHCPSDLDQLFTETETGPRLMFGPARNKLLSYVPEDCDWVMLIDCDEELIHESPDDLKAFLGSLGPEYNAVYINMKDMQDGKVVMDFNTTKFFRQGHVHYNDIVHNAPVYEGPTAGIHTGHMQHYGYDLPPDKLKAKKDRTIGLLNKRIADNPEDWKAYFYKAQAMGFYDPDDLDAIIDNSRIYVEHRADTKGFNTSAYFTLIKALMNKGEAEEAWRYILEARASIPDDLDIAMAMLEYGVWTKQELLITTGALEYLRVYDLYEKDPGKKEGRFIYSHNHNSLVFVTFYQATSQLRSGAKSLAHLQQLALQGPEEQREQLAKDISAALADTGVEIGQELAVQ